MCRVRLASHTWTMTDELDGAVVVWRGRPARYRLVRAEDALFGLQAVVPLPAVVGALVAGDPIGACVIGAFVSLLYGYMAVRLLWRWLALRRTSYEITDLGVRVLSGNRLSSVNPWIALPQPGLRMGRTGIGSISFGAFPTTVEASAALGIRYRWPFPRPSRPMPLVLRDVADAQQVYATVREAMCGALRRRRLTGQS